MNKKINISEVKMVFHSEEPWINVFVLSYITVPLTYFMVNYTKITPNTISIFSLLFGLMSAFSFYSGWLILGSALYLISYIFDATDGKVARLKKSGKSYGAWFDIFVDRVNISFISTGICYHHFLLYEDYNVLFLNTAFLCVLFIGFESRYNIDLHKARCKSEILLPTKKLSSYALWAKSKGVIKQPISLPEIFLFYIVVAPYSSIISETLVVSIFLLIMRLVMQQSFWINGTK